MPCSLRRVGSLAAVLAVSVSACSAPAPAAPAGSTGATTSSAAAGADAVRPRLERLAEGLAADLGAHRVPSASVVASSATAWRGRLATLAAATGTVDVDRYQLSVDPSTIRVSGRQARFTAVGGYHLHGAAPGMAPVTVGLVARNDGGGWRLTGDDPAASVPVPWALPGVRRVTGDGVVVIGNAPAQTLQWYAAAAAQAWRDDVTAWPQRPAGDPVIVVPATPAQFAEQVRAGGRDVSGLAAMTVGSLAAGRTSRGDVVVVNPAIEQRLTEAGRRTILRHELVHVAIRGTTTRPVPLWLTEGYAVQASWAGAGIPAQLAARARSWAGPQRTPTALPTDDTMTRGDLTHAYDISAVLVDDLVTRHGRAAVIAFYQALAGGASLGDALASTLHETQASLLAAWRAAIARLR